MFVFIFVEVLFLCWWCYEWWVCFCNFWNFECVWLKVVIVVFFVWFEYLCKYFWFLEVLCFCFFKIMWFDWLELEFSVDIIFLVLDFVLGFFLFDFVVFLNGEVFLWLLELLVLVCKWVCIGIFLYFGGGCFLEFLYGRDLNVFNCCWFLNWKEINFFEGRDDKEDDSKRLLLFFMDVLFFGEDVFLFNNIEGKVLEVRLGIDCKWEFFKVKGFVSFKLILKSFVLLLVFGVFLFCDDVLLLEVIRDLLWILGFLLIFFNCCCGFLMFVMKFFVVV